MKTETTNDENSGSRHCSPATELLTVVTTWAIGSSLGQLALAPFGCENWALSIGLVLGATTQAAIYVYRKTGPFVR